MSVQLLLLLLLLLLSLHFSSPPDLPVGFCPVFTVPRPLSCCSLSLSRAPSFSLTRHDANLPSGHRATTRKTTQGTKGLSRPRRASATERPPLLKPKWFLAQHLDCVQKEQQHQGPPLHWEGTRVERGKGIRHRGPFFLQTCQTKPPTCRRVRRFIMLLGLGAVFCLLTEGCRKSGRWTSKQAAPHHLWAHGA